MLYGSNLARIPPEFGAMTSLEEFTRCHQVWISLRVATDVLPLLVGACSSACVAELPDGANGADGADGYIPTPRRAGESTSRRLTGTDQPNIVVVDRYPRDEPADSGTAAA
ncbi:hypothetical protein ACHGLA_01040 [Streptomyces sp. YH02]|uniref:hypothetical protein n=1 Tax=Streptomyces sp. YH02 TaxID=3256999 RepID=UPI0037569131